MTPNEARTRYHEALDKYQYENAEYPTRMVISWDIWDALTEQERRYGGFVSDGSIRKTMYGGQEVFRTRDGDILEFLP